MGRAVGRIIVLLCRRRGLRLWIGCRKGRVPGVLLLLEEVVVVVVGGLGVFGARLRLLSSKLRVWPKRSRGMRRR